MFGRGRNRENEPPRLARGVVLRAALAGVLVIAASASAVAGAGILEVDKLKDEFLDSREGRVLFDIPEVERADAGGPRTVLVIGSDKRSGVDSDSPPRSDTLLLMRADPDRNAIALMSIPRDLLVEVPGRGQTKINNTYEMGRERLVVKTVKKLFEDATGENFPINNVMTVDFSGFQRAVNYIGGVYVDVDRDYFNDNSGAERYATIDVNPGYQILHGGDALDYVRYRHFDNDLVRAARQQDFLRQARRAAGVRKLLSVDDRSELARIFGRYFDVDKSFSSTKEIFSMLQLALFLSQERMRVNEVRFRAGESDDPKVNSNLYASDRSLRKVVEEFMNARGSARPRAAAKPDEREREFQRVRKKRERRRTSIAGLEDARQEGRNQAVLADPRLNFPFYFPGLRSRGSVYPSDRPRIYRIRDEQGKRHQAYRLVLAENPVSGDYYGIQGMTWRDPPILDDHDRTVVRGGRRLRLYYDGSRLRLVAWRTRRAVYWVSNTLTQALSSREMLGIAESLQRLKQ
jgi:LCP family protein required for cell wall assembly